MAEYDHIVLYDAECGFCKRMLRRLLARDRNRRLRSMALQDPRSLDLLPGMTEAQRMASWHLVCPDGSVLSGGAAGVAVVRLLPRGRRVADLLARFPRLTEAGYSFVARNRATISRLTRPRSGGCAHC